MPSTGEKRIAIIGAGPVGLEAALYAATCGHDVQVYERDGAGGNVLRWGFVTLFSPWRLNVSPLGRPLVQALPPGSAYPTGEQYVRRYLEPLAGAPPLRGRVHEGWNVRHIGRERIGKADWIGGPRERQPFRLLCDTPSGERLARADVVIDCSGTYGHARWLGNGNLPALGERRIRERIDYTLQDIAGTRRERFAGKRVLLVGDGFSAVTALDALTRLDGTRVTWVSRDAGRDPLPPIPDDPLPERARLARLARELAGGRHPAVTFRPQTTVERLAADASGGIEVTLRAEDGEQTLHVERVLAHVGFEPDNSIYRQLQVHECYATFGPMRLAARLLADASVDCLAQPARGADSLVHPEPGFFILGAKSYGSRSQFLIHLGRSQIRELFRAIERRPELDLYAAAPAAADGPAEES